MMRDDAICGYKTLQKTLLLVRVWLLVLGCWFAISSSYAQISAPRAAQNGQWATYNHDERVQFRLPQTWRITREDTGYTLFESEDGTARMDFSTTQLTDNLTLGILLQEALTTFESPEYTLVDADIMDTQSGAVGRIEIQALIDGQRLRLVQYLLLDQREFILVQALTVDDVPQVNQRRIQIFDYVIGSATYIKANAPASTWISHSDPAGLVQLSAPADWRVVVTETNYVTVTNDNGVTVTANYQPLAIPDGIVSDLTALLLQVYAEQGLPVNRLDTYRLPVGDALLARIENLLVTNSSGNSATLSQYQYAIVRGEWLIFLNLGARSDVFESNLRLMQNIVATFEVIGNDSPNT